MTNPDQPFQPPDQPPESLGNPYLPVDYPEYPSNYPQPPSGYPPSQAYPSGPPPPSRAYPGGPPPYPGAETAQPAYPGGPSYPGGYQPYRAYLPSPPPGTNGMAVGSLVCSLLGLFCGVTAIVGVILGFLAMQQTRQTGQNGYGLALAGVVTGGALLLIWVFSLMVFAAN